MRSTAVVLVEDDEGLRRSLVRGLQESGFAVTSTADAAGMLAVLSRSPRPVYDVLIIDIGLSDADGRDICRALRDGGVQTPVLFLTALDALDDRLAGFDAGGDDYLTKPFHFDELVARLRALARRADAPSTGTDIEAKGVRVDAEAHRAVCGSRVAALTPTELRLLASFVGAPGNALRRADLVRAGWSDGAIVHDNTLDQYVARLRRKLRELGADASIETVRGVGYRFE